MHWNFSIFSCVGSRGQWKVAAGMKTLSFHNSWTIRVWLNFVFLFKSNHVSISLKQKHQLLFIWSVVSDSLGPHGLQHARLPCPLPSPGACSNSCPLSHDAIQSSHPLSSPSPPAFSLSQHQGLFQWVSSSHQVAKVLELQLQHQSLQWIFRIDFL